MNIARDAESTAVIVQRYGLGSIRVRFAHVRCADSHMIEVDADMPDVAALGGMLSKSSGAGVRLRPAHPAAAGPRTED